MENAYREGQEKKKRSLMSVSIPTEILFHVILAVFAVACVIPFIFIIIISFSSKESIKQIGYSFRPLEWSVESYDYVFKMGDQLWRSYFNSFFVTVVGTILSLTVIVLYAYAVYRKDFKYRKFFTFFAFITTMFGGGLAPWYMVCKQVLNLSDTIWALIIPALFPVFNMIIMRTFFTTSIPEGLIEAASIDGAGEYYTLIRIILPISKPGLATIGLFRALAYWNDWMLAMYFLRKPKLYPLQYLLMQMQQQVDFLAKNSQKMGAEASIAVKNLPSSGLRMALVVFIVLPISLAYPFFQRYIISGLTIGSIKG